jgi:DNA-binding FadR family transcriptional regulator
MELKEAKEIIRAGLAWANWTDEQKEAMRIALESIDKVEQLAKEVEFWREIAESCECNDA